MRTGCFVVLLVVACCVLDSEAWFTGSWWRRRTVRRPVPPPVRRPVPPPVPRPTTTCITGETRLSHSQAANMLSAAGISTSSSGRCSNRYNSRCTSLEQIRCKPIQDIIWFKRQRYCDVTVTGGTEIGHSSGRMSHWNGYKLDIRITFCVDSQVYSYTHKGTCSDGAALYEDIKGNVYAREGNHWDIQYP